MVLKGPRALAVLETREILQCIEEIKGGQDFEFLNSQIDEQLTSIVTNKDEIESRMDIFNKYRGSIKEAKDIFKRIDGMEKEVLLLRKVSTSRRIQEINS